MIDFEQWYEQEIGSENKPEYEAAKWAWGYQQAKIDELQARVDSAVKAIMICEEYDHAEKLDEIYNLLKGNKDGN